MATAPPSSPTTAGRRGGSKTRSRSAWSASMCPFRCRWPTTASAAGKPPCSATATPTAPKACTSSPAARPSPVAGSTPATAASSWASHRTSNSVKTNANGLRLAAGMVGGGEGADIGKTHRHAMRLDDHYELVAGVFGRNPDASARMAGHLGVPQDRVYRDYFEMAEHET